MRTISDLLGRKSVASTSTVYAVPIAKPSPRAEEPVEPTLADIGARVGEDNETLRSEIANLESQLAQEAANARALSEANQILVDHANSADKRIVELQSDAAQAREELLLVENEKRWLQRALDQAVGENPGLARRLSG